MMPSMNGHAADNRGLEKLMKEWNIDLRSVQKDPDFHGDRLLADKQSNPTGLFYDLWKVSSLQNAPQVAKVAIKRLSGKGLDIKAGAQLVGSLSNDSQARSNFIQSQVQDRYEKMLHPPLTYLGDAFQYRTPDGKFNSVLHPHLGQAGAPYAKTVPSKTHPLGALPDPGDVFERLMARDKVRKSPSGLSSMLLYHATIIIHDIFRTNDSDKNISDSSSYLDLSPLYGYTMETQRKVRDDRFKLGLLKPDTFAEDRLLRQPPGVCIMLVMYNRYHNYAATQLKRINENGRFSIPSMYEKTKLLAIADSEKCIPTDRRSDGFAHDVQDYAKAWDEWCKQGQKPLHDNDKAYAAAEKKMDTLIQQTGVPDEVEKFKKAYEAAWNKHDDDLFNTARLITCGMYVNVSIHDYLRALMGFHQYNTNFTLDPRIAMTEHKPNRGLGNQVTVEFNLLYRFHCAISEKDEQYTENFFKEIGVSEPRKLSFKGFTDLMSKLPRDSKNDPWLQEFGLQSHRFKRNSITGLFDDQMMINQLRESMDDPISNFGPRNVPRALKNVEIMGMIQARKWEIGTLNDFRDFFGLKRHKTFEEISKNTEVQNALRDLYDHPDKVELYPGVFCESSQNKELEDMDLDPGPSDLDSALWSAIFSDAITLVRSDRFYTVDWNTNSLTSWGMKEVTPDNDNLKSSVFHRLLQRAFPEWFPYDSIRFFHPFYTSQANAKFAKLQGYESTFGTIKENIPEDAHEKIYKVEGAFEPQKPHKPVYLTKYGDIRSVLATGADEILHPAFTNEKNLPIKVQHALLKIKANNDTHGRSDSPEHAEITKTYFAEQMRAIVKREAIVMKENSFQVDVTRDVAIPVVTRCIADFLGFGDQVRNVGNPQAKYSENEIYQHITNCQVFLSYNTDETKLLKRRAAFKQSMEFLLKLAEEGNIREASRWQVTTTVRGFFQGNPVGSQDTASESMRALGRSIADRVLKDEHDSGKAAVILLLTALDVAFISVLAFTAVLDHLLQGAYDLAKTGRPGTSDWLQIQALAMKDESKSDEEIQHKVLEALRQSVKLPFIRKVVKDDVTIKVDGEEDCTLEKDQTIVCDVYEAMQALTTEEVRDTNKYCHLNYVSSLSSALVHFNPKDVALHGLTAMIKVMAQMKNLRRGHTAQGHVKKIQIDQTYEGYANFMAPGRMQMIASDAKHAEMRLQRYKDEDHTDKSDQERKAEEKWLRQQIEAARKIFNEDVLKPKADTYLTAEWDEMIPFPTTWKVRFDGYGESKYDDESNDDGKPLNMLRTDPLPDDKPPFYQPQGASHYGGTFGDAPKETPVNLEPPKETPANLEPPIVNGCGVPGPCLHAAPA